MARLLLDVDEVIVSYCSRYIEIAERRGLVEPGHSVEQMQSWSVAEMLGLDLELEKTIVDDEFMQGLEPLDGAIEGVHRIASLGIELHFVTSHFKGVSNWVNNRDAWLAKYFNDLEYAVHHTHHKYAIAGDVFVDDRIKHVRRWHEYWPHGYACLWNRPCNGRDEIGTATRVFSWDQLYQLVRSVIDQETSGSRKHFRRVR